MTDQIPSDLLKFKLRLEAWRKKRKYLRQPLPDKWLCLRRFSRGRLRWWPRSREADSALHPLEAKQLQVLLYNGLPEKAGFDEAWRKIDSVTFIQAARAAAP